MKQRRSCFSPRSSDGGGGRSVDNKERVGENKFKAKFGRLVCVGGRNFTLGDAPPSLFLLPFHLVIIAGLPFWVGLPPGLIAVINLVAVAAAISFPSAH